MILFERENKLNLMSLKCVFYTEPENKNINKSKNQSKIYYFSNIFCSL